MTHVLLVDDEPLLCEELEDSLDLEGYDVATANSVPEGLKLLDGHPYDVIVTDLKMPKLGGLDLLRSLQERRFPGVVIVVSGHGAVSSRDEAMALGAKACLAKPVDVDELVDVIAQHCA